MAIDFLNPVEAIVEKIKELCQGVTHAFFASYIHNNDFSKLHEKNGPLFRNFIQAVDLACPRLERVVLQTGGKVSVHIERERETEKRKELESHHQQHYGFQYRDIKTPLVEDMPRYQGPHNIFYYEQEDDLFAVQKRRGAWNYNIIRPMAIIGYSCQCTSRPSRQATFLSPLLARHLATFVGFFLI